MHMTARPVKRIIMAAIGLALLLIAGAQVLPGGLELRITPVNGGAPLLVLPLKPDERFAIHYYHSVENAPIRETHSLDPAGRIFIEEERYLKFGAGMGKMPGVGRMVTRGPYEVIEEMHMPTACGRTFFRTMRHRRPAKKLTINPKSGNHFKRKHNYPYGL